MASCLIYEYSIGEGREEENIFGTEASYLDVQKLLIILFHTSDFLRNGPNVLNSLKIIFQIDNPCTFLAQDKVRSFAEQNPGLLLRNTEKAGLSLFIIP